MQKLEPYRYASSILASVSVSVMLVGFATSALV